MASIQSLGVGSGLLTNELVDDIIAAEREPVEARLDSEQELVEARISAYGEVVSLVSGFSNTLQSLSLPSSFSGSTATSTNDTLVSATASSVAVPGTYVVEVNQLAGNHSIASDAYDELDTIIGSGTLTFRFGEITYDGGNNYQSFELNANASTKTLTIDSTNNTLAGIRDAVNDADFGVQATIVDDGSGFRLLFTSDEGGKENSIELVASGTAGLQTLNFNQSSETATLNAVTAAGTSDTSTGAGLDGADLGFTLNYKGTDLLITVSSDPAIDTTAEVLVAVQTSLDSALTAAGFNAGDVVVADTGDRLQFNTVANGFAETLEVIEDGTRATLTGAGAISDGFDFFANNATFSITIDGGAAQAITLNTVTASRQETIDAINAALTTAGIDSDVVARLSASDELVFTRTAAGSTADIQISSLDVTGTAASTELALSVATVAGLDGFGLDEGEGQVTGSARLSETIRAADAELTVNGLSVTRGSNLVAGVISGTTLNLKSTTISPVTLTIEKDPGSLVENIQDFVSAYNELKVLTSELTAFDPSAGLNGQGSILMGDSTLRSVIQGISSLLRTTVSGMTGNIRSLAEVGITTDQNNGFQLTFDSGRFNSKYEEDPDAVKALFSSAGSVSDSQLEYVSAGADTAPGSYGVEVEALATVGSYEAYARSDLGLGNIVIDDSNDEFTMRVNGLTVDVVLTQASYSTAAQLAQEIQLQINSDSSLQSANSAVTVSYDGAANRFSLASNRFGSESEVRFLTADSGVANSLGFLLEAEGPFQGNQLGGLATATGSSAETFTSALVIDAETSFEIDVNGVSTNLLTVPGSSGSPVTYNTPDDLIAAISAQITSDGAFDAKPASTPGLEALTAGQDFSAAPRSVTFSVDGGDTEIAILVNGDANTVAFGGETPGTLANSLAAVQDAIDGTALNGVITASLDSNDNVIFSTAATGADQTLEVVANGTGAVYTGNVALGGAGFDFATTAATFDIAIDSETAVSITIDALTSDRDETLDAVQAALDAAGLGNRVTASLDGSNQLVLTRSSATGASTEIEISSVNATAISELGLSNSSANGLDGFGLVPAEYGGRDSTTLNVDYAYDVSTQLGRLVLTTDDHSDVIELDQISAAASTKLGLFIGDGTIDTAKAGVDVVGKINGIEAQGSGQVLRAATGNVPAKPGFYLNAAIGNLASSTTNDTFKVTVDGIPSSLITLGTITLTDPDTVANSLQSAINNNPAILAGGVGVTVEFDPVTGGFGIISKSTGPTSSVTLSEITGSAGAIFGFATGKGAKGASGSSAQGAPDPSSGIRVRVLGGAIGTRGNVSFVRGIADRLDTLVESYLANNGMLTNREDSLTDELEEIAEDRANLQTRLQNSEDRLRASFLANDLIISGLNTTSDFLSSQLKILEGLASGQSSDD